MSERWKYQIKKGVTWGFMVSVVMAALDMIDMTFEDAFLSRKNLLRIFYFVITGIFIVSYFSWKKKIKSESAPDLPHNNPIHK